MPQGSRWRRRGWPHGLWGILAATGVLGAPDPAHASEPASPQSLVATLLADPSPAEWHALARFDGTLSREEFEERLSQLFDPGHGLNPYLTVTPDGVWVYASAQKREAPVAAVRFARQGRPRMPSPEGFRTPEQFRQRSGRLSPERPLDGLRIAIEPADIGGRWAQMEDRSVDFPGYGRINEGDLNLVVARALVERLQRWGASVFLIRKDAEPVLGPQADHLLGDAQGYLQGHPELVPALLDNRFLSPGATNSQKLHLAGSILITKTLETRARAALVRRSFAPDLTLVLQHNATAESRLGRLVPANRNIFFVNGVYSPRELESPEQRFRLLTKLLEDATPSEIEVGEAISARFKAVTGYGPVLYGNTETTRLIAPRDPYLVARNLAFNREHDGPVVVTEPYFMNQLDTLQRLLAGDYAGTKLVAGKRRQSIFQEYAECVATGVLQAYGPRQR